MGVLAKCPACGFPSPEVRCPRCNALKVVGCSGSCSACKSGCEDGSVPPKSSNPVPEPHDDEGRTTTVTSKA
jgi:hypothetical protein